VHKFGRAWYPWAGGIHTVYLAAGAVVEATLKVRDRHNIRLLGRGLFIQSAFDHARKIVNGHGWYCGYMGMYFRDCTKVELDGIATLCAPSFQLEMANCDGVTLRNLKLCGFGENNNDGFHLYSRNVVLEDAFVAGNDDRICLNGLFDRDLPPEVARTMEKGERLTDTTVQNVRIRRIVFWGLRNGGDIMITWNAGQITRDIVVEDCDSLAATNKAFVTLQHGGSSEIGGLHFRHCRLEHGNLLDVAVIEQRYWGRGGGRVDDLHFEDITLAADPGQVGKSIKARSEAQRIDRVVFKNITANGHRVTALDQTAIKRGDFVGEIVFPQP
jgi:hypothetical protein